MPVASFNFILDQHIQIRPGNVTATGRIYRAVDSFPVAFSLKNPIGVGSEKFTPYLGLGVGTTYGMRRLDIATLSQDEFGWQFLLASEVGITYRISPPNSNRLHFNIRYDRGFGSDAIQSITHLSFAIGIGTKF